MAIKVSQLKRQLKQGDIKPVYLFYGEEQYLIESYTAQLKELVVDPAFEAFNYTVYGEKTEISDFLSELDQYPQMSEKKMLLVRETDFLKSADAQKAMTKAIENLPSYCVVVFIEKEPSKVKKDLLKLIEKQGEVVEFAFQQPADLRAWVLRRLAQAGKGMRNEDANDLINMCGRSLQKLAVECDKLAAAADAGNISRELMDKLVHVPLEYKIFKLSDTLLKKDGDTAFTMLKEFQAQKESPYAIIAALYSQLQGLYMFQTLGERAANYLPPQRKFLARSFMRDCRKIPRACLRKAMRMCAALETDAKSGLVEDWVAVELIAGQLLAA